MKNIEKNVKERSETSIKRGNSDARSAGKAGRLAVLMALLLFVTAFAAACGSSSNSGASTAVYDGDWGDDFYIEEAEDYAYSTPANGFYKAAYDAPDGLGDGGGDYVEEKLVYYADVSVETKNIKDALAEIRALISKHGGKIQSESLENMDGAYLGEDYYYGDPYAYINVRVPQSELEDFLSGMDEGSALYVRSVSRDTENLTKSYYDKAARIEALRVQEERLLQFMRDAASVSEMLEVESRLTDVQYEIDRLTNDIRTIDYDVDYSQVSISVRQVVKYSLGQSGGSSFGERLAGYFRDSFSSFVYVMEDFLAFIIAAAPYLIIIIAIALIVRRVFRRRTQAEGSGGKGRRFGRTAVSGEKTETSAGGVTSTADGNNVDAATGDSEGAGQKSE